MIAYNRTWIENMQLVKKSKQWFGRGLLSGEQMDSIVRRYGNDFYSPPRYIKIGLFIFTIFVVSFAGLFYSLVFLGSSNMMGNKGSMIFTCLLFSAMCFGALEFSIKEKNIFRSGIDEALLYPAICLLYAAVTRFLPDSYDSGSSELFYSIAALPLLGLAVIRYADKLAALAFVSCAYFLVFTILVKTGEAAKMIIPPALMIVSACVYVLALKYKRKESLLCWKDCITVFECFALFAFYASCNYYVIRESGVMFFNIILGKGEDIPLSMIFYILTAVLPLLYIYSGLKRKDAILLRSGLVAAGAAALTFKYYFSLGNPEIMFVIAGAVMAGFAALTIKYLKTPRSGIAFEKEIDGDRLFQTFSVHLAESKIGDT